MAVGQLFREKSSENSCGEEPERESVRERERLMKERGMRERDISVL